MTDLSFTHRHRQELLTAIPEARNHWKMLRRRGADPARIAQAHQRIVELVNELQRGSTPTVVRASSLPTNPQPGWPHHNASPPPLHRSAKSEKRAAFRRGKLSTLNHKL